eukprot:s202_g8.t1
MPLGLNSRRLERASEASSIKQLLSTQLEFTYVLQSGVLIIAAPSDSQWRSLTDEVRTELRLVYKKILVTKSPRCCTEFGFACSNAFAGTVVVT